MNLNEKYGPTMTLKEICKVFKICRSVYYSSINEKSPTYKPEFPKPLAGFAKNIFVTSTVENYIINLNSANDSLNHS